MAETGYALVKDGKVMEVHGKLPKTYQNISGFDKLSDAEVKFYGFIPYTYEQAEYSPFTHSLGDTEFDIKAGSVKGVRKLVELPADVKAQAKEATLKQMDSLLVKVLNLTDWVMLSDSNLAEIVLNSYTELRLASVNARSVLSRLSITDIEKSFANLPNLTANLNLRSVVFSDELAALKETIDNIGA